MIFLLVVRLPDDDHADSLLGKVKSSLTDRTEISTQNSWVGNFTGELNVEQLKDIDCKGVILSHYEWRHVIGEDDQFIRKKSAYALSENLKVIACIREKLETEDQCIREKLET
ncbi:triosephosphate isomerase, chloroplastic-like [Amborella trichopoda]|uniref:triosephosphate isomerase, chloroplastic-like n=1 Tax=Amborella trichopoda TaxID=13333 RepID=UPI0005D39ACC|nr:triosephosphate isomerase, chloroplastic-like [Amborella trichopoda]|eukprot:XP_011622816.1 triosephosphate isomerase, chloroplastic-like [Amborella trichopoda]